MTRKKVKLAFITNDSARKATYKKRKKGLLKKMDELTTLCDVKACAILYSPYEARPVVWPGPSGAREVIASFKRLPEMEKVKKMVSQEEFLRQRVVKAHDQLKRQQKENREKEMTHVMYQCLSGKGLQNMSLLDLSDLGWMINRHLIEINKRIENLKKENNSSTSNNNDNNDNNNIPDEDPTSVPPKPTDQQLSGGQQSLQGQNGDFYAMQMMMQPWSSFMDMIGPPAMHDHHAHHYAHHHHHHEMGMGNGLNGGVNSNDSSSSNGNGNMMMGQFGEYHSHGVNPAMWSNAFFP